MRAGLLRHLVTIEDLVTDLDSDGATVEEWVPVYAQPVSAQIVDLSGRELIAAQAVQSKVSTRIVLRYRPGIRAKMRVVHRDVAYNIEAVIADMNSRFRQVTLLCTSGTNTG